MPLIKIYERQYDAGGNPIYEMKKDMNGNLRKTTKSLVYYMDLNADEEALLKKTGRFAFEVVFAAQREKLTQKQKKDGVERKKEILKTLVN